MSWADWWVWIVAAVVLGVLEMVMPAQIFLGFAIGAALTGLTILAGVTGIVHSLPLTLLVFAVLSGIAWVILRRAVGVHHSQVKHFDRDINED